MINELADLLTVSSVRDVVNGHEWIWPVCEMIHYVGMSLIIGVIGILDLRLLGLFKSIPVGALKALVPLAIAGFIGNLLTGIVFVTGTTSGAIFYIDNLSFQLKLTCLLIAGVNLLYFRLSGLEEIAYATSAGSAAPAGTKVIAVVSITTWLLTIFFGRMLMYNDTLLLMLGR